MHRAAGWLMLFMVAAAGLFAQSETDKTVLRSRVYKLRNIESQTAKALLERLKIGTEYNTLSKDVLIVTSNQPLDLVKATGVVTLADKSEPVDIRPLLVPTAEMPAPKLEELAVRLKTLSLGTLEDAPPAGITNAAIVDTFEGTFIAIGTPTVLDAVEKAVSEWKAEKTSAAAKPAEPSAADSSKQEPASPAEPNTARSPSLTEIAGQIFGDTEKSQTAAEPNLPETPAVTEPEAELTEEQKAIAAVQRQVEEMEKAAQAEGTEVDDEGLRAVLEALLKTGQQEQQKSQSEPVITPAKPSVPAQQEEKETPKPEPKNGKTVTAPALPKEKAETELELTITLPEEVEIEALLELVGKQLGLNYMYDPALIRGQKVMLKIHDGKIKVGDLYALLESVLRFRGFVMTRRVNLVTIAKQDQVGSFDPTLRLPDEPIQPGDVVVSSIFKLNHVNTTTVQNLLTQMKLGTAFTPIPEAGTLIITDYAFRMDRIREVITMIDVEGTPKDFRFRQLKYMQASELVPKVKALSTQMQGVTVTVGGQTAAAPPAAAVRTPQIDPATRRPITTQPTQPAQAAPAAGAAAQEVVYLEADERTNRVLMIGYPNEIEIVNQLIDSLDVASYDLRFVKEYVIQYVEATDVVTVLNELGLARVTVGSSRQTQTTASRTTPQTMRQPVQPGQPQPAQQVVPQTQTTALSGGTEPYISLRAATNSLLVNATDEQHKAIELVISHVDVLQKDQRTIREYEIQFVDTQAILDTLADLGIITPKTTSSQTATRSTTGTSTSRTAQQQQQAVGMPAEGIAPMALPTAEGTEREILAQEPQIAVLAATNSLLVHATPRQHAAIALVIAHADRDISRLSAPYVVYSLENQESEVLAEVLNKLIKETVEEITGGTTSSPDAKIQTKTTGPAMLPSGEEQRIKIIPDKDSRSIIVYANKRNQQWIGDLIRKLDEYRPQVLLDVTLVNITRDDEFKFDLELISRKGGFTPGGTSMTKLTPIVTPFPAGTVLEGTSNYSASSAFYSDQHIQAMLNLLDKKNYGRVLAKPSILVKDNQEGIIKAENVIYVAEPKVDTITPATGASSTSTNVTFKDYTAGLTLTITPHIAAENLLQLKITLDRKDFAAGEDRTITIEGNTYTYPKNTTSSNIDTMSILPDGATIVLGGIESLNQGKTVNKVPILGDLPLIGTLFRGINEKDVQSRLYVFVKANIIRPGDELTGKSDIERISQKKRQAFEEFEAKFQGLQAVPGLKPNPIQPERVLEDDEYIEELKRKLDQADKPVTVELR
jgi:type II secretory pathway component GspD/PulD (secretin)